MLITLMTYGSRGDVAPFIALGQGFLAQGHAVRLAAPGVYAHLAEGTSIDYVPLPGEPDQFVRALVQEAGDNYLRMAHVLLRYSLPLAAEVLALLEPACEGADAIVHSFLLTMAGAPLARKHGIPDYSAQFFPVFHPTSAFPPPSFPHLPLGGWYNRATHHFVNTIFHWSGRLMRPWIARRHPGVPRLNQWPFAARHARPTPMLYAFSPHVVPKPKDWGDQVHVSGYWFPNQDPRWEAPDRLRAFLEQGPPPVYIGFGSTITSDPQGLARIAVQALERNGQRGILAFPQVDALLDLPASVFGLDYAPHAWLFPRVAAVVHHGGAGTTGAGLRAGVPNILVPFTSDQPFWAWRVQALGVGPQPIPAGALSVARLAQALQQAVEDKAMIASAAALGERIRAEHGVRRAVKIVLDELNPSRAD